MLWHASSSPWSPCSFQNKQTHFAFSGPFPCDICGRNFNDTGNRRRHIECTHGGKRKWMCFVCGKSVRERCDGIVFTVLSDRSLECCCPPPLFFFFFFFYWQNNPAGAHADPQRREASHLCSLWPRFPPQELIQVGRRRSEFRFWLWTGIYYFLFFEQAPLENAPQWQALRVWPMREDLYTPRSPNQTSENALWYDRSPSKRQLYFMVILKTLQNGAWKLILGK